MQSAEYARMYELEDRYWWFVARRELALQFLAQVAPANATILDVGCGTGKGQDAFGSLGTVYGVDFSQDALEFCHQRGLSRIARADAQALPLQSNSFDVVVTLDTIEHVPDDQKAIAEIARVLKPGGHILINVPAYQWLWGPHDVALMHHRRYSRTQVRKLLEANGFQIERLTYHIFFLFPLVAISRFLSKFRKGEPDAKLPNLPRFVEGIFSLFQRAEAAIIVRSNLPWGSSIVAVARKK
ncbi:MAG: class I SAM-dependent methyltransferase [Armatimonadetes bacterium]|nr:class I SAM-dependent methyltransferase [Armatimonadota bacterium]